MKKWKVVVGVFVVFLLGLIAGGLLTVRFVQKRAQQGFLAGSPRLAEFVARRLDRELRLDEQQRGQVLATLRDTQRELRAANAQIRPELGKILFDSNMKIRAVLRPDQQEKYDRILAERRARWMSAARGLGDGQPVGGPTSPPPVSARSP